MPIRFRCVYCDKLLGIARRKAGAVVNCPHCGEKLIVPTPDPADMTADDEPTAKEEGMPPAVSDGAQLFERSDFDALLNPAPTFRTAEGPPAAPPPRPAWQTFEPAPSPLLQPFPAAQNLPMPPPVVSSAPPRPGFHISPSKATWLSVFAVILLAAAFGAGFMVARMMKG